MERQTSAKTWLRAQFPSEVLPIKLDRVVVTVRIRGPVRRIEIAGKADGETVVMAGHDSPVGTVKLEINETDALLLDEGGRSQTGSVRFSSGG